METWITIYNDADQEIAARLLATSFAGTILAPVYEGGELVRGIAVEDSERFALGDYLPEADSSADDGADDWVRLYRIDGVTVCVTSSGDHYGLEIRDGDTTLLDAFGDWDFGDTSWAEGVAQFDVDPKLSEAEPGTSPVSVWVTYYYNYGHMSAPTDRYVRVEDVTYTASCRVGENIAVFATYEEAERWIKQQESGRYVLAQGEYSRPEYRIVDGVYGTPNVAFDVDCHYTDLPSEISNDIRTALDNVAWESCAGAEDEDAAIAGLVAEYLTEQLDYRDADKALETVTFEISMRCDL